MLASDAALERFEHPAAMAAWFAMRIKKRKKRQGVLSLARRLRPAWLRLAGGRLVVIVWTSRVRQIVGSSK